MARTFAIVSGLPGSGKTTLARPLSATLGLPLLDKDDILESLFDSRASDRVLQDMAAASQGAVLTSFWRRESLSKDSGTPTERLREVPDAAVVEVFCNCPPLLAAERFAGRHRHPGHFDQHKTTADVVMQFERLAALGPLGMGPLVQVDTSARVAVGALAQAVLRAAA